MNMLSELSDFRLGYLDGWQEGTELRWDGLIGDYAGRDKEYNAGRQQGHDDANFIGYFWDGYLDGLRDGEINLPHRVVPMNYTERPEDAVYWDGYSAGWIDMYNLRKQKP